MASVSQHGRVARAGAVAATVASAHSLVNLRQLTVPPPPAAPGYRVSALVPMRNEAAHAARCLRALLTSVDVPDLEVLVYDDASVDDTARIVTMIGNDDPRCRLIRGGELPAGWLGKPHACARLAAAATGEVLVFLDADVTLTPDGLSRTVAALTGRDAVCPYPRQLADGPGPRLVQPLLQWSWLTFLPLRRAERSTRPSLSAANGQLLAVRAAAYHRAGGHRGVRAEVLEDLALVRALKRHGGRVAMADGTHVASCRMYGSWADLREGYRKSLWSAFGPPPAAAAAMGLLTWMYVLPPLAWLRRPGDPWLAAGTLASVGARAAVARRVAGRVWPDSAAHPVSVALLVWLTASSHVAQRRGRITWKARPVQ